MESQESQPQQREERISGLYFYDGNIVIRASRKDESFVYFRVHKSVLAQNSPIFRDMFSIPAPEKKAIEMYDSTPLVHLHDDSEDLEDFLRTFYNSSTTTSRLIGPLELATKYQVDHLRSHIIARLEQDWPSTDSTLSDWERLRAKNRPKPELVIRLARDYDVPTVLIAAFYQLSTCSASSMNHTLLRIEDVLAVLAGREKMHAYLAFRFPSGDVFDWVPYNKLLPWRCNNCNVHTFWSTLLLELLPSRDPLGVLRNLTKAIYFKEYITCLDCRDKAYIGFEQEYKLLFAELPKCFGLARH